MEQKFGEGLPRVNPEEVGRMNNTDAQEEANMIRVIVGDNVKYENRNIVSGPGFDWDKATVEQYDRALEQVEALKKLTEIKTPKAVAFLKNLQYASAEGLAGLYALITAFGPIPETRDESMMLDQWAKTFMTTESKLRELKKRAGVLETSMGENQ